MSSAVQQSFVNIKEMIEGFRPTMLFEVTFTNGVVYGWSDSFDGNQPGEPNIAGLNFNGLGYSCAVQKSNVSSSQGSSGMGIDAVGSASFDLADADGRFWNYELAFGFAGAALVVYFAFYDPVTALFSTDYKVVFNGICDAAARNDLNTSITASSTKNMSRQAVPYFPIQRQCPKNFPATQAQRSDGANNFLSIFWDCGYSPDISGGVGNLNGGVPFTSCAYSKSDCQARGMYSKDSSNRNTARFGASQYVPPATWKGGSYTTGKSLQGVNNENLSKYTQFAPLNFGATWVNAVSMNTVGDPNTTRGELILAYGDYQINSVPGENPSDWIPILVLSGLLVPYATLTKDNSFCWYLLTTGNRSGVINDSDIYNTNGGSDPYGSMVAIMPVVYNTVANSATNLDVKALMVTRPIPVWTGSSFILTPMDLTPWCILEIIRLYRQDLYSQIDINSVTMASEICGQDIPFTYIDGTPGTHRRFGMSISIGSNASVAQVLEGMKENCGMLIVPDPITGKIIFTMKGPLFEQQPSPPAGTNNNAPIPSRQRTDSYTGGNTQVGYSAYDFDESSIIPGSFKFQTKQVQTLPTVFQANIQDEQNRWTPDTVSLASLGAYAVSNTKTVSSLKGIGFPNYDQAYRVGARVFAETWRGNPRGDYGGTMVIQFSTSFKGQCLRLGHIIRVTQVKLSLSQQQFRIESIANSANGQNITITARWHEDIWYCDNYQEL